MRKDRYLEQPATLIDGITRIGGRVKDAIGNQITSLGVGPVKINVNSKDGNWDFADKKDKGDPDDWDEKDAWGDVRKAKLNIGQYEKNINGGVSKKPEKTLSDILRPYDPNDDQEKRPKFQIKPSEPMKKQITGLSQLYSQNPNFEKNEPRYDHSNNPNYDQYGNFSDEEGQ